MKRSLWILTAFCLLAFSQTAQAEEKLKYFLMIAEPSGAAWKGVIEGGGDMADTARPQIEAMGGQLLSYYIGAGEAKNYGVVAFPDSMDTAQIIYLRAAQQLMKNFEFIEVIPSSEAVGLFEGIKAQLE